MELPWMTLAWTLVAAYGALVLALVCALAWIKLRGRDTDLSYLTFLLQYVCNVDAEPAGIVQPVAEPAGRKGALA